MIKMIFSDLDGTLIPPQYGKLPEEIPELIRQLKEKGVDFCAASGRQFPCMYKMFEPMSKDMYFIANNGGDIHYHGETLRAVTMDRDDLDELLDDIMALPGVEIECAGLKSGYTTTKNEPYLKVLREVVGYIEENIPDMHNPPEPFVKVAMLQYGKTEFDPEIVRKFQEKYGESYDITASGNGWVDFMMKDVGKGNAVRFMKEKLNLGRDEIAVFGDNENDLSMLLEADRSYCMPHSPENVKSHSRFVAKDIVYELRKILTEVSNV